MIEDSQREEKSRSQVKREFRETRKLGIELAGLSTGQLQALPLSEDTRAALLAARTMTRGALQRQYRYIASLLAREDTNAVRAALAGDLQPRDEQTAALREAERWRDELISADETQLASFVERHPGCDRTRLRQLVRNAKKAPDEERSARPSRQLVRYLQQLFEQQD